MEYKRIVHSPYHQRAQHSI